MPLQELRSKLLEFFLTRCLCMPCLHCCGLISMQKPSCGPSQSPSSHRKDSTWAPPAPPRPQQAEMGSWLSVWEHTGVTQTTTDAWRTVISCQKPIWNWHQAKAGCVFPWAISQEGTRGGASGILENCTDTGTNTPWQAFGLQLLGKDFLHLFWLDLVFEGWGSKSFSLWTRKVESLTLTYC